jgi:hypothetical protein
LPTPASRLAPAVLLLALAGSGCDGAPSTTWHEELAAPSLEAVAWSGSRYAAVGYLKAGSSPDGAHWTWSDAAAPLSAVCWTGQEFLAVGNYGAVATSPDGLAWTDRSTGDGAQLFEGVASSGSRAVAVGNGPVVWTSEDLTTWTANDLGGATVLSAVIFTGQGFVAVGHWGFAGAVATSPDGLAWTLHAPVVAGELTAVAWSGTWLVAVGGNVYTSTDGASWEVARRPSGTPALTAVTWTGHAFLAVGRGGTILSSRDGLDWAAERSGTATDLLGVAAGPSSAVAVGPISLLSWP